MRLKWSQKRAIRKSGIRFSETVVLRDVMETHVDGQREMNSGTALDRNEPRPALVDPHRPALVGLQPVRPADRLRGGAHLLRPGVALTPQADEGYVTSVAFSPAMQSWIGLGLLRNGPQRHGESIRVWDPVRSGDFEARIGPPIFVDPSGQRVHG